MKKGIFILIIILFSLKYMYGQEETILEQEKEEIIKEEKQDTLKKEEKQDTLKKAIPDTLKQKKIKIPSQEDDIYYPKPGIFSIYLRMQTLFVQFFESGIGIHPRDKKLILEGGINFIPNYDLGYYWKIALGIVRTRYFNLLLSGGKESPNVMPFGGIEGDIHFYNRFLFLLELRVMIIGVLDFAPPVLPLVYFGTSLTF